MFKTNINITISIVLGLIYTQSSAAHTDPNAHQHLSEQLLGLVIIIIGAFLIKNTLKIAQKNRSSS